MTKFALLLLLILTLGGCVSRAPDDKVIKEALAKQVSSEGCLEVVSYEKTDGRLEPDGSKYISFGMLVIHESPNCAWQGGYEIHDDFEALRFPGGDDNIHDVDIVANLIKTEKTWVVDGYKFNKTTKR